MLFIKIREQWTIAVNKSVFRCLMLVAALLSVSGCTKFLLGEESLDINPIEEPVVNITGFTQSLECMDELLLHYDVPMMVLTAQDIPNMAGEQSLAGTKDMLITSLSKMGERSGKIRFVSYGTDLKDILLVHRTHEMKDSFQAPDFFIRGSITQHDKGIIANRIGGALRHDDWNAALAAGHSLSYVSLDLNMGLVSNLQMLPGISSNNILALTDRGFGNEFGGSIESAGLYFDFGVDRRDGIGQALRNLVDLGTIEMVGKLSGVPYLSCLPMDFKAPPVVASIRKEFRAYRDKGHLVRALQGKLKQYSYYEGEVDGKLNRDTLLAIDYYRRLYGVAYDQHPHEIDFALYKDIVYGDKYQWDVDPLAGRPEVRSFDQPTLIANDLVKPKQENVTKQAYDAQSVAEYYRSLKKKTAPVAYYGSRHPMKHAVPRATAQPSSPTVPLDDHPGAELLVLDHLVEEQVGGSAVRYPESIGKRSLEENALLRGAQGRASPPPAAPISTATPTATPVPIPTYTRGVKPDPAPLSNSKSLEFKDMEASLQQQGVERPIFLSQQKREPKHVPFGTDVWEGSLQD